jgi:CHASE3 domain sensor protein
MGEHTARLAQIERDEKKALAGYRTALKNTYRRGVYVGMAGTIALLIVALALKLSLSF